MEKLSFDSIILILNTNQIYKQSKNVGINNVLFFNNFR